MKKVLLKNLCSRLLFEKVIKNSLANKKNAIYLSGIIYELLRYSFVEFLEQKFILLFAYFLPGRISDAKITVLASQKECMPQKMV